MRIFSSFTTIVLFLVSLLCVAQGQVKWELLKHEGRDYVSMENVKQFYRFQSMKREGNRITMTARNLVFQLKVGDQEIQFNGVKFICTYPVIETSGKLAISRIDLTKLVDPVLRPSYIARAGQFRTVVLDPGHGGKDAGAVNQYGTEKAYNLRVATELRRLLMQRGFKVVMTRTSDVYLTLQERVDLANALKEPAIFISIHFNAGSRSARGVETFTLSPQGVAHYGKGLKSSDFQLLNGNQHDSANIALATAVHGQVIRCLGKANTFDRGIKRARYSVLTGVKHPAILLEGGFMSHGYEARLIANPQYIAAVARGVCDAVVLYQKAVNGRRANSASSRVPHQ
ncbi:MAG: N-acetylmuramoyl-L-alanine amidase [Verrucomicrobia bacterium]|nr:MAG: N-acetylmuramoyl-L-alanine amidase [Verrucomicrobiota bacterium]TAE90421.1 MAG: N-acetylmuramoyl-L-alanine amidase [Verrucomicrobiota bacterium]